MENGHLIGTLRRIVKLLSNNIRPVFVFDGPAPPIKQRILRIRARKRQGAEQDFAELAEKVLMNQLQRSGIAKVRAELKKRKKKGKPKNPRAAKAPNPP